MHGDPFIVGTAGVLCVGALCQWLGWRTKVPSILLLLGAGALLGPVTGALDPDAIYGEALFPAVSLAAALVLFEGGLATSWQELRRVARPVRRFVTLGVVLTFGALAAAARIVLGMGVEASLVLGAVLVVTGPTVIGPLLRTVRPRSDVASILRLEGVLNDPIGAILAILVFQGVQVGHVDGAASVVAVGIAKATATGVAIGLASGWLVTTTLRGRYLPAFLQGSTCLALAVGTFALADALHPESGLLAVTVMGMTLASREGVDVEAVRELAEHLVMVLLGFLFIVLAARVRVPDLAGLPGSIAEFVGLVFLARVLVVFASTIGTQVDWRGRVFLALMAPRGVVAAAVASVFGMRLSAEGFDSADLIMPVTFVTIVATVAVYGGLARPVARWLKLIEEAPRGVIIEGGGRVARALGKFLHDQGFLVLLVEPNPREVERAQRLGLRAIRGSLLNDRTLERIETSVYGALLVLSEDYAHSTLVASRMAPLFDGRVVQLAPDAEDVAMGYADRAEMGSRSLTHRALAARLEHGARFALRPSDELGEDDDVLFWLSSDGRISTQPASDARALVVVDA